MSDTKKDQPSLRDTFRAFPFVLGIIYQADKKSLILMFIASVFEGPLTAVGIFALKYLIDALTVADADRAMFWTGIIIAGTALRGGLGYVRELYSDLLRFNVDITLQRKNLEYILRLPYKTLEDPHFQELASTFDRRSSVILNVQNMLPWMMRNIFGLFGLLAVFAFLPWPVIVLVFVSQCILFLLYRRSAEWNWHVISFESQEGRRASYHQDILSRPSDAVTDEGDWAVAFIFRVMEGGRFKDSGFADERSAQWSDGCWDLAIRRSRFFWSWDMDDDGFYLGGTDGHQCRGRVPVQLQPFFRHPRQPCRKHQMVA